MTSVEMRSVGGRTQTIAATDRPTVVVLGGGINGAALARELLLSGVSVVVVEAEDIACGATAWSTRLVHGGLRYLEYGEIGLVRESLAERNRLVRLAAHLVKPLEFYLPVESRFGGLRAAAARICGLESLARRWHARRGSWTVGMGLALYDLLSMGSPWPWHRMARAGGEGLPQVDAGRFPLAAIYVDAQMLFPERFTAELFVDARRIAAETGAEFSLFTRHAARLDAKGRLSIEPGHSQHAGGALRMIEPAAIVNATGAWVDRTLAGLLPEPPRRLIGGTKGSHIMLATRRLRSALGRRGVYAEAADGRPVFVLPFGPRLVLVGTTDIPFAGDPAVARADEGEIAYLLAAVARLFPATAPDRAAVVQHYCGVRPLPGVGPGTGAPASITRRHMLVRQPEAPVPCWSIVGGKLTTCRSLAESAAREILSTLRIPVRGTSRDRPLPGNVSDADHFRAVDAAAAHAQAAGMSSDRARRAASRAVDLFGSRGVDVCAAIHSRQAAAAETFDGSDLPVAAARFCIREEWATALEDLVERRLMLSFEPQLSRRAIEQAADALVEEGLLGRDAVSAAVEQCVAGLRERYGKIVAPNKETQA
ncbi:MAG: glycerol-3-phosphate dehydrogenase/oxidase [Planctomycetia bacterium]